MQLGFCCLEMDDVSGVLSQFRVNLVSLNAWKCGGLTFRGLSALATIPTLKELDLGWT